MLRESATLADIEVDMDGLADPACTRIKGVADSEVLLRFVDTYVSADAAAYAEARAALCEVLGETAMVDAVGVASNFQRLDRIADATGIPSDPMMAVMQEEFAQQLGLTKYPSASNTPQMSASERSRIERVDIPDFRAHIRRESGK